MDMVTASVAIGGGRLRAVTYRRAINGAGIRDARRIPDYTKRPCKRHVTQRAGGFVTR